MRLEADLLIKRKSHKRQKLDCQSADITYFSSSAPVAILFQKIHDLAVTPTGVVTPELKQDLIR